MNTIRSQYVALFKLQTDNFFRSAYLDFERGLILSPIINIGGVEYIYSPNQYTIAKTFKTSQQNVSRCMKNKPSKLDHPTNTNDKVKA